ncbi:MAG: DUF4012 domain-containing protein [Candidatus Kerfeldbacteria bacterium]|nr:DUF4012 domain-containing protein [Candidatus Kerfeldbacteria bacterium]
MLNFLKHIVQKQKTRRRRIWVTILMSLCLAVATLAILIALYTAANYNKLKDVYSEAMSAKQSLEYAQTALSHQNFDLAQTDLEAAKNHFLSAQEALGRFTVYKWIPGLAEQVTAIDNLLNAGINISTGMKTLARLGGDMFAVLQKQKDEASFADLTAEDKRSMLQVLADSTVDLHGVRSEIGLAVESLNTIPSTGLLGPVKEAVDTVKDQLPLLDTLMNRILPTAELLPAILGYPTPKTYLFLLQNNRELRPTGGFIGTYGIFKVNSGEFNIYTDNIYNLDNPASSYITEPSPAPIAKHTTTQNWLLRNINWSPDFPTTARKAESKYHEEGGAEPHLDGVIAVTPTFIESLLGLVGPITVDGVTFTQENFFQKLQYEVEFAYYDKGISDEQRKEIIGRMSKILMDKLLTLPRNRFVDIWNVLIKNIDEKQILIYVDEPLIQELVEQNNWSGEMHKADGDYLMVVDANLAALKTDEKMERSISYSVKKDGDNYVGVAEITYTNTTQQVNDFYTRYRTHTRIYLPQGSTLRSADGFLTNDIAVHHGVPTQPTVHDEMFTHADGDQYSFTVVEGFSSIEPKETRTVRIEYTLPEYVEQQINTGTYDLYIQKQPGTIAHGLTVRVDVGKSSPYVEALDMTVQNQDNSTSIQSDLSIDRHITITY